MANSEQEGKEPRVPNESRREFLRNSAVVTAGAVTMGLATDQGTAAAEKSGDLNMIAPTFEESPTYLATYKSSDRAKKIMQEATVIDALFSAVYPLQWKDDNQFHPVMDEVMASGINVLGYCTTGDVASYDTEAVLAGLRFPLMKIAERPDKYMVVRSVRDMAEAKKQGKLGFYFVHQGTKQFGSNVHNVALMKQLGFGYCLLVYNNKNAVGGGCADDVDDGLTPFGRQLIQAYNRYGLVVDVSHTGNRTSLDACEVSTQPVIASHSGAKGVFPAFRNLSDELIKALAGTGGVTCMFGTGGYIDPSNPAVVGPEILFKHIDYMCQLIGNADHVGYGSDWIPDMTKTMQLIMSKASAYPDKGVPPGTTKKAIEQYGATANPARILPAVVDQLLSHGYSEKDSHKILGGNLMRVFEAVWDGADVKIDDPPDFEKEWR